MLSLAFSPSAIDDLRAARLWYEEHRPGLGMQFQSAVELVLDRASRSPLSFPTALQHFRRAAVRRFPYDIYYRIDEERLIVVLIIHTARHPGAVVARLQQH